jgi:hypothetical protein
LIPDYHRGIVFVAGRKRPFDIEAKVDFATNRIAASPQVNTGRQTLPA